MQLWFQVIRAMFPMSVDIAADPNTSKAPRRLQATLVKGNYKKNAGPETQTTGRLRAHDSLKLCPK